MVLILNSTLSKSLLFSQRLFLLWIAWSLLLSAQPKSSVVSAKQLECRDRHSRDDEREYQECCVESSVHWTNHQSTKYSCQCSKFISMDTLFNYWHLHYCLMKKAPWIGQGWPYLSMVILIILILLSFFFLASTADYFLVPTLQSASEYLSMTPTVAGATLLALANGAPDAACTIAGTNGARQIELVVGSIVGGFAFVSIFTLGVCLICRPFYTSRRPFIRETGFTMISLSWLTVIIITARLYWWEGMIMVVSYIVYIALLIIPTKYRDRFPNLDRMISGSRFFRTDKESKGRDLSKKPTTSIAILRHKSLFELAHETSETRVSDELHPHLLDMHHSLESINQPSDDDETDKPMTPVRSIITKDVSNYSSMLVVPVVDDDLTLPRRSSASLSDGSSLFTMNSSENSSDIELYYHHRIKGNSDHIHSSSEIYCCSPRPFPPGIAEPQSSESMLDSMDINIERNEQFNQPIPKEDSHDDNANETTVKSVSLMRLFRWWKVLVEYEQQNRFGRVLAYIEIPWMILRCLTIPCLNQKLFSRLQCSISVTLCPLWVAFAFKHNFFLAIPDWWKLHCLFYIASLTIGLLTYFVLTNPKFTGENNKNESDERSNRDTRHPHTFKSDSHIQRTRFIWISLISVMGGVSWTMIFANELVQLLSVIAMSLRVSDTFAGLTLLAWGNSIGDLLANRSAALSGHPEMAVTACFASPIFNTLVSLGLATLFNSMAGHISLDLSIDHTRDNLGFLIKFSILPISLVILTIKTGIFSHFYMGKVTGYMLIVIYVLFVLLALWPEFDVLKAPPWLAK